MNHRDASEIVAGLVLSHKLSPDSVNPQAIASPYDLLIEAMRVGRDRHEIIQMIGLSAYQAATQAEASLPQDTTNPAEYLDLMNVTSVYYRVGSKLERMSRQMMDGNIIPLGDIQSTITPIETRQVGFVPMSEVEATENVWMPTGISAIDTCMGGLIEDGFLIIGAAPGSGKTTMLLKLAVAAARMGKHSVIFSLEMPKGVLKYRLLQLDPTLAGRQDLLEKIIVYDGVLNYNEVYAEAGILAAKYTDIHFIGIDYAELMLAPNEKESAEVLGMVYRTMYHMAKKLKTPVILLSQLNANYVGGPPQVNHIRYTRLAEATASIIWLLYNPRQMFLGMADDKTLPYVEGQAYIIFGKSRFGYKMGGVGALQVGWAGQGGWQFDTFDWRHLNQA